MTDGSVTWAINNAPFGQSATVHNSYFRGAELPYTWAELQAKIAAGDFSNLYIGDYKEITLTTGEKVIMEIAGIAVYVDIVHTSFITKHHIDFISRDCLATSYRMNATNTNNGTAKQPCPWLASELYKTLNDESTGVYSTLPANLKPYIIPKWGRLVEKYSSAGLIAQATGLSDNLSIGKLWLPIPIEVLGFDYLLLNSSRNLFNSLPGIGINRYPIFLNSASKLKGAGNNGVPSYWWTCEPYCGDDNNFNTTCFIYVTSSGVASIGHAASEQTVLRPLLCFRIG